jgi:hypothetical protein
LSVDPLQLRLVTEHLSHGTVPCTRLDMKGAIWLLLRWICITNERIRHS